MEYIVGFVFGCIVGLFYIGNKYAEICNRYKKICKDQSETIDKLITKFKEIK